VEQDCIFCKIAAGAFDTQFVYKDEKLVAFRDMNPQAPVHILIIPRRHIPQIRQLKRNDDKLVGRMILVAIKLAEQEQISESGYRLVFNCGENGGQEVDHIHLHLFGGRKMTWPPG
jgi:histidine triad (HIT) family protein